MAYEAVGLTVTAAVVDGDRGRFMDPACCTLGRAGGGGGSAFGVKLLRAQMVLISVSLGTPDLHVSYLNTWF